MNPYHLMGNASAAGVAKTVMAILHILQQTKPEEQLMASALLSQVLTEHYRVRVIDLHQFVINMRFGPSGELPEFKALNAYVKGEFPRV